MAQVEAVAAGTTASVEVEGLLLLVAVEDQVELAANAPPLAKFKGKGGAALPMREEGPSTKEKMRLLSRQLLETCEELRRDRLRAELVDELIVVDSNLNEGGKGWRKTSMNMGAPCYKADKHVDLGRRARFERWPLWRSMGRWRRLYETIWVGRGREGEETPVIYLTHLLSFDDGSLNVPGSDDLRAARVGSNRGGRDI